MTNETLTATRCVVIPAIAMHEGNPFNRIVVTLPWVCPQCGGPRGAIFKTISYDGSRRLDVDGWKNPCGHIDTYAAVRLEAKVGPCKYCGTAANHPPEASDVCPVYENIDIESALDAQERAKEEANR